MSLKCLREVKFGQGCPLYTLGYAASRVACAPLVKEDVVTLRSCVRDHSIVHCYHRTKSNSTTSIHVKAFKMIILRSAQNLLFFTLTCLFMGMPPISLTFLQLTSDHCYNKS